MSHQNEFILRHKLASIEAIIPAGSRWAHYKRRNANYTILAIGLDETQDEPMVIYQAEYGKKLTWVRPAKNF